MRTLAVLFVLLALACSGCKGLDALSPGAQAPTEQTSGYCAAPANMTGLLDQDMRDSQLPWKRRPGVQRTRINFVPDSSVTAAWRTDLEYGARQWNRSVCLDVRIVAACPPGGNCVTVSVVGKGDDGNFDAEESGGFTTGGHIELLGSLSVAEAKNVAVHEMGHAVGLRHRKTERVLMNGDTYDDVFDPDATDLKNLLFLYGRQVPQ